MNGNQLIFCLDEKFKATLEGASDTDKERKLAVYRIVKLRLN